MLNNKTLVTNPALEASQTSLITTAVAKAPTMGVPVRNAAKQNVPINKVVTNDGL